MPPFEKPKSLAISDSIMNAVDKAQQQKYGQLESGAVGEKNKTGSTLAMSEYFRSLLAGPTKYYVEELMGAPISSFSAITNDKLTLAKILDGLNPGCPSWNPAPLEHIGGELPCKDPYPIFRGIPGPKLRVPKEWPAFPGDIFNAAVSLVDRIEVECGAKMACQFRIVFEKLMGRRLHPNEALRTILAILNPHPEHIFLASQCFPAGYEMEVIAIEDGSGFFAAHISPRHVTYYCNSGIETFDEAIFYKRCKKSGETVLNLDFHHQNVPSLFLSFAGNKAIYFRKNSQPAPFRIGRFIYDASVFELPKGWKPEFNTPFSETHGIPSNLPSSPNGDYYFAYLIDKLKTDGLMSETDKNLFEAWFMNQHFPDALEIVEEIQSSGHNAPKGCIAYISLPEKDQIFATKYALPYVPLSKMTALINEGVFSRDWAEAVGMYPVEKHEGPQTRAVMFRDPVSRGILQSSHKPWEAETAAMAKVRHVKEYDNSRTQKPVHQKAANKMKPIASGEIYRSVIQTAAPMYLFKAQETRVITVPSSSSFPAKATAPVNLHAVFSKPAPEKKTATDKPTVPQTIGGNLQTPDHTRTFFGAPAGLVGTVAGNTMANQRLPQTKPEAPGASIQKVQVDSPVQSSVSMPGAHFLSHRYPPGDILGAKRYLPPGTAFPLPPHLAGEGKFIPPVTSFGIYGVDDSTKQEYFSSGEWLVSEGSKWWKKVLRDHGVEGKAAEEIPSPGWVLVKSGKSTFFEARGGDPQGDMNRLARVYGDHFYRSMYNPQPGTGHLVFPAVGDWVLEQMQSMKARSRLREKEKAEGIQP